MFEPSRRLREMIAITRLTATAAVHPSSRRARGGRASRRAGSVGLVLATVALAFACGDGLTGPGSDQELPELLTPLSVDGLLSGAPLRICGDASVVDLPAKDGQVLGTATISNDEGQLTVLLEAAGEWELAKSQLSVSHSLADIPTNRSGKPQPGRFPYRAAHEAGTTRFAFLLPLADLAAQVGDELVVVVHVDMVDRNDPVDAGDDQTMSAWGDGIPFEPQGRGDSGGYSLYEVQGCDAGIAVRLEELVAVTDAVTIHVRRSPRSNVAEAVSVSDAVTLNVRRPLRSNVIEAVSVSDAVTLNVRRPLRSSLEESVAVSDEVTIDVRSTLRSAVAETVGVTDQVAVTVVPVPRLRVDEAVGVADEVTINVRSPISIDVAEAVGVTDDVAITVVPQQSEGWVQDAVLPAGGEFHAYPFPGKAGQPVRIHASLLDDVPGSARMSLIGPSGGVLYPEAGSPGAEGWATSSSSASTVVDLQEDGVYSLRITSGAPGARYRVGLGTGIGRRDPAFTAVAVPRGTDSGLHFLDMVLAGDEILTVGGRWLRRFSADGAAVSGFGSGGAVDLGAVLGASGKALALQPDGKILVAARVTVSPYPWKVARFGPDGVLDPTFGAAGIVTLAGLGTNSDSQPVGIALLGSDIVVGGIAGFNLEKVGIVRLEPDGSLDTSFGGDDGLVVENGGSGFAPVGFALDTQGRILVLDDESMRRYLPDGARDSGFGSDGLVHFATDLGVSSLARATGFSLISGDRMAVVGLSGADGFLMKLQSSGQLDASFATTGWLTRDFGLRDRLQAVVEDAAGNLVVVGHQRTSETGSAADYEFLVARFRSNGDVDGPFGHVGYTLDHRADDARAVALDTQGRIVVGGESPGQRSNTGVQVLRLLPR